MAKHIHDAPKKVKYDLIFFPDLLPEALYNTSKLCSREESLTVHLFLKEYYQVMGFRTIDIPFDTSEKRVEFILNTIAGYKNQSS